MVDYGQGQIEHIGTVSDHPEIVQEYITEILEKDYYLTFTVWHDSEERDELEEKRIIEEMKK